MKKHYCLCRATHPHSKDGSRLDGHMAHIARCPVCGWASYTAAAEHGQERLSRLSPLPPRRHFEPALLEELRRGIARAEQIGSGGLELPRAPHNLGPRLPEEWGCAARDWAQAQVCDAWRECGVLRSLVERARLYARPARRLAERLQVAVEAAEARLAEYERRAFARIAELEAELQRRWPDAELPERERHAWQR